MHCGENAVFVKNLTWLTRCEIMHTRDVRFGHVGTKWEKYGTFLRSVFCSFWLIEQTEQKTDLKKSQNLSNWVSIRLNFRPNRTPLLKT